MCTTNVDISIIERRILYMQHIYIWLAGYVYTCFFFCWLHCICSTLYSAYSWYKLQIKFEFEFKLGVHQKTYMYVCVKRLLRDVKIIIWVIKLVPCSNYMINQPYLISTAWSSRIQTYEFLSSTKTGTLSYRRTVRHRPLAQSYY